MSRKRNDYCLWRRNGIFYVRIWDAENNTYGVAKSTGIPISDKRGAEQKAAEMFKAGLLPTKGQPTAIDYILERINKIESTEQYRIDGRRYMEVCRKSKKFANLKIGSVEKRHLLDLVDYLKDQKKSNRTINRIMAFIKPALRAAADRKLIKADPTAGFKKEKENLDKRGELTISEIQKILELKHFTDCRIKAYVVIGILTGLRKGEMRALKWSDVDLLERRIYVRRSYTDQGGDKKPKTEGSARPVFIVDAAFQAFEDLRKISPYTDPSDHVFFQPPWGEEKRGVPLPSHFTDKAFNAVLDAIGINEAERERRHLVPHSMRHTFVRFCRSFLPDTTTGKASGHDTAVMLDHYGKPGSDNYPDAIRILNAALSVKPEGDDKVH